MTFEAYGRREREITHPLALARTSRGWSQEALASRIRDTSVRHGVYLATSKKTVAKWEHGVVPDRLTQNVIAQALEIPDRYIQSQPWPRWLFADNVNEIDMTSWDAAGALTALNLATSGAFLDRRAMLGRLGAALALPIVEAFSQAGDDLSGSSGSVRVGSGVVSNLKASLLNLRRLGDQLGGGATQATVLSNLDMTVSLIREGSYPRNIAAALYQLAAGFAQLAGFNSVDMGRQVAAQNLYIASLHAAAVAKDYELNTYTLSWMSYQAYSTGHDTDAVGLAEIALSRSRSPASPGVRGLLLARGALGAAHAGEKRQFSRLAALAENFHSKDRDPTLTSWFNEVEMQGIIARGMLDLRESRQAEALLRSILRDPRMADNPRSEAVYRVRLSTALAQQGRVAEAFGEANAAADFAEGLHSRRTIDMLWEVARILATSHTSEAADLSTRLRTFDGP